MDNQNTQPVIPHSHKKLLYGAVGFSILAVILLSVVLVKMSHHEVAQEQIQQNGVIPTESVSQTTSQQADVTPLPVTNKQDVSNALQQVDNTDPSVVSTDLNQNASDASQFSQ